MSSPFVAEIRIFGGNFAPRGWAFCNGQLLPISQNTALFSLLGVTYGGNGTSSFALPDLRDRFPLHPGQGPGLSQRYLGETGGQASVTLLPSQIPSHTHSLQATSAAATEAAPSAARMLAVPTAPAYGTAADLLPLADAALEPAGGGQPHENRQPYLALTFLIALQGIYPARN